VTRTRARTQDPKLLGATVPSSSPGPPGALHCCAPSVRDGQVYDVPRSPSLQPPGHSRYVVSLFLFSERQPTGPSGCSFLPAFHNYTSQQLAVHLRRIFLHGPLLYCSVFRLHVLCATVREPDGRDVLLLWFIRGRVRLKEVSGLLWLSVCSRRHLDTQN